MTSARGRVKGHFQKIEDGLVAAQTTEQLAEEGRLDEAVGVFQGGGLRADHHYSLARYGEEIQDVIGRSGAEIQQDIIGLETVDMVDQALFLGIEGIRGTLHHAVQIDDTIPKQFGDASFLGNLTICRVGGILGPCDKFSFLIRR